MSSPFDDDRNRPRNRRDTWERQRKYQRSPRRRNAARPEQDPYLEEYDYNRDYYDEYDNGHYHADAGYYESDRENRVHIPERSRRLGSLLEIYERPDNPRLDRDRTERMENIRRERVRPETDYYESEQSGRFPDRVPLIEKPHPPVIDKPFIDKPPVIEKPSPPPVDIPPEPQRSSFEYQQREEHGGSKNGKDFQFPVKFDKKEFNEEKPEALFFRKEETKERGSTESQAKINGDQKVLEKKKMSNGSQQKNNGEKRGSDAKPPSVTEEVKTTEVRKRPSLTKKLETLASRPALNGYQPLKQEDDDDDESFFPKENGSVLLPVLEDSEKSFHDLVASGDVSAVSDFLKDHPEFNINCVNYQKISALHVAVHGQNEEMVKFLLSQPSLDVTDCVLHAVKSGNIKIVEMILDRIRETSPGLEDAVVAHSVDFSDDMTPLILAAQLGNYEMIDFLIKRDHKIPPVHGPYCKCETCKSELIKYDHLRYSTKKLDLYKAISNPMYIFHVTDDPILKAFELVKELQDAARVFPQFYASYEELWKELRSFSVDLIRCCRNSQEVEIVLKKPSGPVSGAVKFPRLQYAIDLKQKEFVSHAYTQAVLGDAWTGELLEWKIRSPVMQALCVFPRIPMLPFMTVMCIFMPNHSLVKKWKIPVNKMISSCASYLIFLLLLFLESNLNKRNQKRGPPHSGLEWIIIIYVVGYIWDNIRLCFKIGTKRFFSYMWHWFDCIMLLLFVVTFLSWLASWADVKANNEVDLPRKYWNSLDPLLIAEGFFAVAVVMAFFRLFRILSLNYYLGPFMVSIGKMTLDLINFTIIFFILLLAWTAGFCRFYQPYEGMIQKDAEAGTSVSQVPSFINFEMTLKTFFWAIFGMSPMESADVIIENLPGDTPGTTIINRHEFTETVGYISFAVFVVVSSVIILNMLIACMANTFTKVIDNVGVEWVFGRSQVYLSYMAASTLPSPFNLIPTASGIKAMFTWFRLCLKPKNNQKAKCNMTHCCFIENDVEPYVNSEFPLLMSELAQRYLRMKEQDKDESPNQEAIDSLKTEINEFKEILKRLEEKILEKR